MFLLKSIFKLFKVMNSETSARALASAMALGIFIGFVPLMSLQGILAILAVLFLRVNITLALTAALVTLLTATQLEQQLHELGLALLDRPEWLGLWSTVDNNAILSTLRLTNTVDLGSTVVGVSSLVPTWLVAVLLVKLYRDKVEGWILRSRFVTFLGGLKIVSLYRSVMSPFG